MMKDTRPVGTALGDLHAEACNRLVRRENDFAMGAAQGPTNDYDVPLGEIDRTGAVGDHSLERGR